MSTHWWSGFLMGIIAGWASLCLFLWSLFWWEDMKLRKKMTDRTRGMS